jgi:hypothetical protein
MMAVSPAARLNRWRSRRSLKKDVQEPLIASNLVWCADMPPSTFICMNPASSRTSVAFAALVLAQTAHSIEEYAGRLWESFPPAALLTGLISADREFGFVVINSGLVAFGWWCLIWPVRRNWLSAPRLIWFWIVIETINGIGHPAWSFAQGWYTPGVATAPILLALALYLSYLMRRTPRRVSRLA